MRAAQGACKVHRITLSIEDVIADLRTTVQCMRELGVLEYNGIKLGPNPSHSSSERTPSKTEQLSPLERAVQAREHHRALAMAASGGPVKRPSDGERQ